MAGVIAVWFALGIYEGHVLARFILARETATSSVHQVLMATVFVYIIALVVAIGFFRPIRNLFHWDRELTRVGWPSISKQLLWGVVGGLLVSLLSAPLPITHQYTQIADVADYLSGSNSAYLFVPIFTLLIVAVSICTELFFRGIVLRTLTEYTNLLPSIIASCLLSAYLWSFNRPSITAVILGAVTGILFYKTRFLLSSIATTAVFLCIGPLCSAIFHRLVW